MNIIIPINTAEAIIDPFWDPGLSGLSAWERACAPEASIYQNWCNVPITWEASERGKTIVSMRRDFDIDVTGYDRLVVSLVNAAGASVRIAVTGRGVEANEERHERFDSDGEKHERSIDVSPLSRITRIELEFFSSGTPGSGWLNWIGLQNSERLATHLRWLEDIAETVPLHICEPESISYRPHLGIVLDDTEADALKAGSAELERVLDDLALPEPQSLISDFIVNGPDTRYSREREHEMRILGLAETTAVLGIALERSDLLKRAAEYAVVEALTPFWDWGFISRTAGSAFEIRSFMQGVVCTDLVAALDLARDYLTESARSLIERRIAEDGVGNINFNSWKFEYIHNNNQLAAFSTGRIAAYCALEKSWPRITPYLELAVEELVESLKNIMLPDGGFVEGPAYLHYTMSRGLVALEMYGRARGKKLENVVPEEVLATRRFADALASTDQNRDHIPICDAHDTGAPDSLALLATLMPDSAWTSVYRRRLERSGIIPGVQEIMRDAKIPATGPPPSAFIFLEEMRLASSHRNTPAGPVKIVVLGNRPNAGHTHEDKGSFIIEAANQTIAMDPGICAYSDPLTDVLKTCQRHNMLVPTGTEERPHPVNPNPAAVEVSAEGDETRFFARIDCTPGWERWYKTWIREIDSPDPSHVSIRDRWNLERGTGVAFLLQTVLPVEIDAEAVRIGDYAVVYPPEAAEVSLVEVPYPESDVPQKTIRFAIDGTAGDSEVRIEFR